MNNAKEKGQMKRLFAIFLLILVLLGRIGEKEIFASENVNIGIDDTENGDGSTSGSESGEDGSTPGSESDGDGSVSDNELAGASETEVNGKITIKVIHDFLDGGGAEIVLLKGNTEVRSIPIGTASGTFEYDLDSEEYDNFYIKKAGDTQVGNTTVRVSTENLKAKKAVYGGSLAVQPGGWINTDTMRSVNFGVPIYIKHNFTGGATVCYVKGSTVVKTSALPSDRIVLFDLESTEYDGFYIKETTNDEVGNKTDILKRDDITAALDAMKNALGGGYFAYGDSRRLYRRFEDTDVIAARHQHCGYKSGYPERCL